MERALATGLIDQLCREIALAEGEDVEEFDYDRFRERVTAVAAACSALDCIYVWQYALGCLDRDGLLPAN